jgi:Tfp pilus assembly PilM family ATPase
MRFHFDRIRGTFTEPLHPPAVFLVSRTRVGGLVRAGRDGRIAGQAVVPLAPGVLEPSFDKRNVSNPAALERAVRDAAARLGRNGGPVGLMVPEACLKVFVLPFEGLPTSPRERDEVLRWRLAKLAPLPPAEMRLSYAVLKTAGHPRVVLALARVEVVREYEDAFSRAGLTVRDVGIPALNLLAFARPDAAGHALVVNLEDDHLSLTALLDGRAALYRFKPFLQDPLRPMTLAEKIDQAAAEVETTVRFVEDREKKTIAAAWVRADVAEPEAAVAGLQARLPGLAVREPAFPAAVRPPDRHFLAPLVGQGER